MKSSRLYYTGILILCVFIQLSAKDKPYQFKKIELQEAYLVIDFEIDTLFTKEIFEGLRKGMTAAIEYQIQIWRYRAHWVNQLIFEKNHRLKIGYDSWERKYSVTLRNEAPRLMDKEAIEKNCSCLTGFKVIPVEKLESGLPYKITITIVLQPMSVENLEEIRKWLAGEAEDLNPKAIRATKSPWKRLGDWALGLIVNLSGFGDRVITATSPRFTWKDGVVVLDE